MVLPTTLTEILFASVTPDNGWFTANRLVTWIRVALVKSTDDTLTGVDTG
jgi:hypothetical protein